MITLDWFDAILSPNIKMHWGKKRKANAWQRFLAKNAARGTKPPEAESYPLRITFYPPNKRGRDLDNCIAAIKSALDGIAEAWGVNDKQFRPIHADFGEVFKGGKITIEY